MTSKVLSKPTIRQVSNKSLLEAKTSKDFTQIIILNPAAVGYKVTIQSIVLLLVITIIIITITHCDALRYNVHTG